MTARRSSLRAAVVAVLCLPPGAHAAPLSLAVAEGPVSLPVYVAQARGYFAAQGLELRVVDCSSGRDCYRLLAEGRADLATAAELQVILGSGARPDIAILATISASAYQIKIVARRSAQVGEAAQLRGKRIGTVPGSSAQYFLDGWLLFNDVDPATVKVVGMAPERLVGALDGHGVDAIAIWEPLAAAAAQALGGDAVTFANPRIYTQYFNLLATRPLIARRGPEIERVLRALVQAQRVIAADPQAATALLAQRLRLPPVLAAGAIDGIDFRIRLDQSLVTTMQGQVRWALRTGQDDGQDMLRGVDPRRTIAPEPLLRLDPDAVGVVR